MALQPNTCKTYTLLLTTCKAHPNMICKLPLSPTGFAVPPPQTPRHATPRHILVTCRPLLAARLMSGLSCSHAVSTVHKPLSSCLSNRACHSNRSCGQRPSSRTYHWWVTR